MNPNERQLSDAISVQLANLRTLMTAVKELRASRGTLDVRLLRMGTLTQEHLTNGGHAHLTPVRVTALLAAMDALDGAFSTTMQPHGVTPAIAITDALP